MSKKQYRIRNRSQYNKALVNRGSLTLWFDENSINNWHNPVMTGKSGRPRIYSDMSLSCALTLRAVFHLPLRATQGLLASLIAWLKLPIQAPNYSTLSRRQEKLTVQLNSLLTAGPLNLVIDSTGLKIYGAGEWKVRKYGLSKRRTWRKLHLSVNPKTHGIEAAVVTGNDSGDSQVLPSLLEQVSSKIDQVCADGAYDAENCYQAIQGRHSQSTIPPRRGAKFKSSPHLHEPFHPRDQNLKAIKKWGIKRWQKNSGYHQRSLAETAMSRFKTLFTGRLRNRRFKNQEIEALIKCRAINIMTKLGMPITVAA